MVISVATLLNYGLVCSDLSREISGNCPKQWMPSGTTCYEPCRRLPDYHLQESSHVHTFLTWCYIIWMEHLVIWLPLWWTNRRSLCLPNTRTAVSAILCAFAFTTCSKSKCTKNCSCAAAGVNCIVSCKCTANPRLCARIAEDSEDDEWTTITSVLSNSWCKY